MIPASATAEEAHVFLLLSGQVAHELGGDETLIVREQIAMHVARCMWLWEWLCSQKKMARL
jgi:hypothetical protein